MIIRISYTHFLVFVPKSHFTSNFNNAIFNHIIENISLSTDCQIALNWLAPKTFDDQLKAF